MPSLNLLEHRMGIKYTSATWAHHALKLMKPQHFVQVGIRASSKPKEYWMERYPIQQFWADGDRRAGRRNHRQDIQHFADRGIRRIYVSNDIDVTTELCCRLPRRPVHRNGMD